MFIGLLLILCLGVLFSIFLWSHSWDREIEAAETSSPLCTSQVLAEFNDSFP